MVFDKYHIIEISSAETLCNKDIPAGILKLVDIPKYVLDIMCQDCWNIHLLNSMGKHTLIEYTRIDGSVWYEFDPITYYFCNIEYTNEKSHYKR